jgi:hypothetical protein
LLATAWGLRVAVELGSAAIAALSIIAISLAARRTSQISPAKFVPVN